MSAIGGTRVGRVGLVAVLALAAGEGIAAQGIKLNDVLSRLPGEQVESVAISPDGDWALYTTLVGDWDEGTFGLFSVRTVESPKGAARLGDVAEGTISPDSRWVVYRSGEEAGSILYSIPIEGSSPRIPLAVIAQGTEFRITRRSPRVVYGSVYGGGIHVVPIDGSAEPMLLADGAAHDLRLTPDDERAVYTEDRVLYSVPLDGSSPAVRLDRPHVAGDGVGGTFEITADSARVVYLSDEHAQHGYQLFSVPVDGSATAVVLNPPPASPTEDVSSFQLVPDADRVVYQKQGELFGVSVEGGRPAVHLAFAPSYSSYQVAPGSVLFLASEGGAGLELYSTSIDGSHPPRKLSAPLRVGGNVTFFAVDPSGKRAVYRADPDIQYEYRLFSVSILEEEPPIELQTPPLSRFGASRFMLAGSHVLFSIGAELYSVPIDGSEQAIQLSHSPIESTPYSSSLPLLPVGPDGSFVLLRAATGADEPFEAFRVHVDDSAPPLKLNASLGLGEIAGDVGGFAISPEGERVLFVAGGFEFDELHAVAADGSHRPLRLQPTPGSPSPCVLNLSLSSDGLWAVYQGFGSDAYGDYPLLGVPVDGSREPAQISSGFSGVDLFRLAPQGDRVVYDLDKLLPSNQPDHQLCARALDGSGPEIALGGAIPHQILYLHVTPDGERAVYAADPFSAGVYEIASVPLDGSAGPLRISAPLVANGDAPVVLLSPDGTRAVYFADQIEDEVFELFSAPVEGGATPVRLTPGFVAGGDVQHSRAGGADGQLFYACSAAISPDSSRVLYVADQEVDERFELYSVPIDGGVAMVKLNGPLVAGGDLLSFQAISNGGPVLYVADQEVDEHFELYAVPTDGSAAALKLSAGTQVSSAVFRSSPDGTRVAFLARASLAPGAPFELYSARIDGSRPPVKLNAALVSGGEVGLDFRISPNGAWVAYTADQSTDGVRELFVVAIDGNPRRAPEKLNGPLVAGGDVRLDSLQFHPDSRRVYYVADQEVDERFELYLSFIGPPRQQAQGPLGFGSTSVKVPTR